jgi:diguanylate cyclase (GGDEF)-like protein/PAS domain S-box-containing protein
MDQAARSDLGGTPFRFRHSRAVLQNMLDNAAVATFLVSPDSRLLYANRAFYNLLGFDENETVSVAIDDLVHPDDAAMARQQILELIAGRAATYRCERRYLKKNGEPAWVLVSASAIRDETEAGRLVYVIVQAISIDAQKRAEVALAESESRWNFALESAGQGVWDADRINKRVFYSRMWRIMRGMQPDEAVDSRTDLWLARVHPDDRERVRGIVTSQHVGRTGFKAFEYRERHRDGHWIWILSRGKPVAWSPDGSPSRIIGTDTDISSLKQVEGLLAEEKERLNVTLQSIADSVISTDADGRVTFMNPAAEQMTGWPAGLALDRKVEDLFSIVEAGSNATVPNPVAECLRVLGLVHRDEDTVLLARGGTRHDVRVSASPVRTPRGDVIGAVLVFQDVTTSRALQRRLAHTAMHDSLTDLPNRQTFERAVGEACEQARRERREHALCFLDLDRFKAVNDSAGHSAGDALLRAVADAIRASTRGSDFAARIGGDEFGVLIPDVSVGQARALAQGVVDAIAGLRFAWQGATYEIGASVGVTAITAKSFVPAELMNEADAACYVAKATGRNRVAVYEPGSGGLAQLVQSA